MDGEDQHADDPYRPDPDLGTSPGNQSETRRLQVLPGACLLSNQPGVMLVTILGSCICACIRDPALGIGGMNHFLLPHAADRNWRVDDRALRYGQYAMERLLNELFKRGADRHRLEIKLFGGASMFHSPIPVGENNIRFIHDFLEAEALPIAVEDLGGGNARRVHYFPRSGKVLRLQLGRNSDRRIFTREESYLSDVARMKIEGDIELFDHP